MDYLMQADIHRVVTDTLADLGKPDAHLSCLNLRVLSRDGYYTGHAIQYEEIQIVLGAGESLIEFYGTDGTLLKTVAVDQDGAGEKKAA